MQRILISTVNTNGDMQNMPDDKTNIPVNTPDVPTKDNKDNASNNLNIRASDQQSDEDKSHMGAKESQVEQKKPPTQELGNLSDRPLEKGTRKDDDDPVDEITPG
jgi:catalase